MKLTTLLAAAVLLAAADDPNGRSAPSSGATYPTRSGPLQVRPIDTPTSEVCLGDVAPNFSYVGVEGRWRRLRDLVAPGPVLLLFGPDELTLRVIEHERERLLDLGVIPVAVTDMRTRAARAAVSRFDLRFTVLSDAQGIIAGQFNALDPRTGRHLPTWFVVDQKRRVRGLGRKGLPLRGYATLAANALGLPATSATLPASR